MKLLSVVLPKIVNFLGKPREILRMDSSEKPNVVRLEYVPEQRVVVAEFESRKDQPTTMLIPIEQVALMVPVPSAKELKSELTLRTGPVVQAPAPVVVPPPAPPDPAPGPTEEEAAEIRRQFKAKFGTPIATAPPLTDAERQIMGLEPNPVEEPVAAPVVEEEDPVEKAMKKKPAKKKKKAKRVE